MFSRPSLGMMVKNGFHSPDRKPDLANYLGDAEQSRAIGTIFEYALRELKDRYEPIETALRNVRVPSLVLWGDKDPFFSIEQGRKAAEACRGEFRLVPGSGHFIPDENPEIVASEISRFLR